MKPTQLLASALALSPLLSAWPWPPSLTDIKTIAQENGLYQKRSVYDGSAARISARQDGGGGNNQGGNNQGGGGGNGGGNAGGGGGDNNAPPPSSGNAPPPSSGNNPPPSSGGSAPPSSGSDASSGSDSAPPPSSGATDSKSGDPKTTAPPSSQFTDPISPGAQPGGINMIQPNTQSTATQYYKVDQVITWVWNYTSLSRPPSAIDVLATVSGSTSGPNPPMFTLATNYSFNPTESFTWDTGKYVNETRTLPMGMYTLMIYDAGAPGGVSATASPGYLGLYNQFHFGMYPTQAPTSVPTPFQCSTCNAAGRGLESLTVGWLIGVVAMTVTSFMWFSGAMTSGYV